MPRLQYNQVDGATALVASWIFWCGESSAL